MGKVNVLTENDKEFRVGDFILWQGSLGTIVELKPSKKLLGNSNQPRHQVVIRQGSIKKIVRISRIDHMGQDAELINFTLNAVKNLRDMDSEQLDTLREMVESSDPESVNLGLTMIHGDLNL